MGNESPVPGSGFGEEGGASLYNGFWWSAEWAVCHGCASRWRDGRRTSLAFRVGQCARPLWIFGRASTVYWQVSLSQWRRCSSVGQPNRLALLLLTLEVFLSRLMTKRAARLWTASILAMFFCEYGSRQTQHTPTAAGRSRLYSSALMFSGGANL